LHNIRPSKFKTGYCRKRPPKIDRAPTRLRPLPRRRCRVEPRTAAVGHIEIQLRSASASGLRPGPLPHLSDIALVLIRVTSGRVAARRADRGINSLNTENGISEMAESRASEAHFDHSQLLLADTAHGLDFDPKSYNVIATELDKVRGWREKGSAPTMMVRRRLHISPSTRSRVCENAAVSCWRCSR